MAKKKKTEEEILETTQKEEKDIVDVDSILDFDAPTPDVLPDLDEDPETDFFD